MSDTVRWIGPAWSGEFCTVDTELDADDVDFEGLRCISCDQPLEHGMRCIVMPSIGIFVGIGAFYHAWCLLATVIGEEVADAAIPERTGHFGGVVIVEEE